MKKVQLAAPGKNIISTYVNNDYVYMTGTSMSAPMVSGVAALLLSYYPELTPSQLKSVITSVDNVTYLKDLENKVTSSGTLNAWNSFSAAASELLYSTSSVSEANVNLLPSEDIKKIISDIKAKTSDEKKTNKVILCLKNENDINLILNELNIRYNCYVVNYLPITESYVLEFDSVSEADEAIDYLNDRKEVEYAEPSYYVINN